MFSVSAWLMTGSPLGIVGGLSGFLAAALASRSLSLALPERVVRAVAVVVLYLVGFVVLVSELT